MTTNIHIIALATASNGTTSEFHNVTAIQISADLRNVEVGYSSWPTMQMASEGMPPISHGIFRFPVLSMVQAGSLVDDIKVALVGPDGFGSGTVLDTELASLEAARQQQWAALKIERARRIDAPKLTSIGMLDAGPVHQDNLGKVLALLRVAVSRGAPDAANYTLADNTRGTFTVAQLEDAALAIGAATQALYDTSAALRAQIDAATTVEQVLAVVWPTPPTPT